MSERSRGSGAGRGECDTACPSGSDGLCPSSNSPVPLFLLQHQPLGGGANVGGETAGGGLAPSQPWPPSGFVSSSILNSAVPFQKHKQVCVCFHFPV